MRWVDLVPGNILQHRRSAQMYVLIETTVTPDDITKCVWMPLSSQDSGPFHTYPSNDQIDEKNYLVLPVRG